MKRWIRNWLKKRFGFFDRQDIENAMGRVGNCNDRGVYEWRFKTELFK